MNKSKLTKKKTTKAPAKPINKSKAKPSRAVKSAAKTVPTVSKSTKAKSKNKTNKSATNKKFLKFKKKLFKKSKRLNKKIAKSKTWRIIGKIVRAKSFRFATIVLAIVIAAGAGFVFGHKVWGQGTSILGQDPVRQSTEAPSALSAVGPTQSNSLFTMYPAWAQNFSNDPPSKLSSQYWNIYQGVPQNDNNEAEYYTANPTNLNIKNGALNLVATEQTEPDGYSYASSRIDTEGKISFLYGRIDVTAKLPDSIGSWPAIWFLPANNKYEDMSPSSDTLRYLNGGEIDLAEEVGYQENVEYGVIHTVSDVTNPGLTGAFNTVTVPDNESQYNTYTLLWTPTSITFEINNTPFFAYNKPAGATYTTWAFDQPFYMIANLALGGSWGGQDTSAFPGNGIDNASLPVGMSIKSVYYYPYTGN